MGHSGYRGRCRLLSLGNIPLTLETSPGPCLHAVTYCTYSLLASQPGRSSFHYSGRPFVKVSRQRAQGRISYIQNEIFIGSLPKDTLDMNHKKVIHAKRMENRKTKVVVCVS